MDEEAGEEKAYEGRSMALFMRIDGRYASLRVRPLHLHLIR